MKKIISLFVLLCTLSAFSQFKYAANKKHPFGKYNPKAPKQVEDYKDLIGISECTSETRKQDGSWNKPGKMIWEWKYIMNGMAVQDQTLKEDGLHSGSIRQYDKDSLQWNVHYYSSSGITAPLSVWKGNKTKEGTIVLYRKQKAPNGMDGFYRLTFSNISPKGFDWVGEWVDTTEKIVYPTWKIACRKRKRGI